MKHNELSNLEFVDFFLKTGKEIHYKKGDIIMRPDDIPSGLYFVKKGYVRIYSITEEGAERLHIIYQPKDVFPLMWVLKNEQKKVFYEAMDNVVLYRVKKDSFLSIIKLHPNCMMSLISQLTDKFSMFSDRIDDLEVAKTYPRVVSSLIFFANHYGQSSDEKVSDSRIILPPITQQDIANFSSMTRETASREMSKLEKKKIITYKKHLIVVNQLKSLNKELIKV